MRSKFIKSAGVVSSDGDPICYLAFAPCVLILISIKIIMEELNCCTLILHLIKQTICATVDGDITEYETIEDDQNTLQGD